MTRHDVERLFSESLRSPSPSVEQFHAVALAVLDLVKSGSESFFAHVRNRIGQIAASSGERYSIDAFDLAAAHRLVANEVGFPDWAELVRSLAEPPGEPPLLFTYAVAAMVRGDFTALEQMIGGPDKFDHVVRDWYEKGYFEDHPETLAEIFSASCMLGHAATADYLLDKGVDPYAGMSTGLAGFHYAASNGRLDVIKLLIDRKVPMEVKNMYDGTVFGQAIWSAVNEYTPYHAEIVEELVKAGALVDNGYLEWWNKQNVPDGETKRRVAAALRGHAKFHEHLHLAKQEVDVAEANGNKRMIADSLKALGNVMRRPPFLRDSANEVYGRAAPLYDELDLPLEAAWVKRHIGINHEYAGRLEDAESYYDEALALYRKHSTEDDLDYANAVRYPAVIKERLGKKDEAAKLWEEAHDRYARVHPNGLGEGVAEAAAWLTILAIERNDLDLAANWFTRASEASSRSEDPDTHKFIAEVHSRLEQAQIL